MKGLMVLLAAAATLAACASASEKLAQEVADNHAAGRPVLIYALGVEHTDTYIHTNVGAGIGLINTGSQAITGVRVTIVPYQLIGHTPPLAQPARTIDLGFAIPAGGIPPEMALQPTWDNGSSLLDCLKVQALELRFADGSTVSLTGKQLDQTLSSRINRNCTSGQRSPDYKEIPQYSRMGGPTGP